MIRQAQYKDIPQLIELGRSFYNKGPFKDYNLNFNELSFQSVCMEMIMNPAKVIFVFEENKLQGMLGAHIVPWIGDLTQTQLIETFYWVNESNRKNNIAKKLIEALEIFGNEKGITNIIMAGLHNENMKVLERYYSILGYEPLEITYIKENLK
jgi:hypothetical protein